VAHPDLEAQVLGCRDSQGEMPHRFASLGGVLA